MNNNFYLRFCVSAVRIIFGFAVFTCAFPAWATSFIDLSKAANMGLSESFDEAVAGAGNLQEKNGLRNLPTGSQNFRGIPFQIIDPAKNQGRSFVVLKGRRKPDFPEGISISGSHMKVAYLYFLHTCRWGGTASNITVAEYDIVYDDGQIVAIPLRVGVEFTNFFSSDDTSVSFLAWWHKYKNIEMGINFFPWKNPHPDKAIQSILFKSRGNMPVPMLFAITASDKELPISPVSPKPEKEFKTDTSKWIPFEPSGASPTGTAIDMSFLLDAPAGKHGPVKADGDKLVFEDGTPAKFWGVRLSTDCWNWSNEKVEKVINRLAVYGCNLVGVYRVMDSSDKKRDELFINMLVGKLKNKGIYFMWNGEYISSVRPNPSSFIQVDNDNNVIPEGILNPGWEGQGSWSDVIDESANSYSNFISVKSPDKNPLSSLTSKRFFGIPFLAQLKVNWSESVFEWPLLFSATAGLQGWSGVLGFEFQNIDWNSQIDFDQDLNNKPGLLAQWPIAALSYLRGDLKEGRIHVLGQAGEVLSLSAVQALMALAHRSGIVGKDDKIKTDRSGELKAKINEKNKSFVSDTGQITWQGNVGVVKVEAPRFQALIGILSHRKFNNAYWAVETPNSFASLSAISLSNKALNVSEHLLLTGVTRMENTGQTYNAAKTKLLSAGKAPILVEPLAAKIVLYRFIQDPKLKIRALDASGQPLKTKVSAKWVKNNFVFSWVPTAFYLEIYK